MMNFLLGFGTGVSGFVLTRMVRSIYSYVQVNGFNRYVGLLIILIYLSFTSCSKDEITPDLCGDCNVTFDVPFEIDENGYYHAQLRSKFFIRTYRCA